MEFDDFVDWRSLYQKVEVDRQAVISQIMYYLSKTDFKSKIATLAANSVLPRLQIAINYGVNMSRRMIRIDISTSGIGVVIGNNHQSIMRCHIPTDILDNINKELTQAGVYTIVMRINGTKVYDFSTPDL